MSSTLTEDAKQLRILRQQVDDAKTEYDGLKQAADRFEYELIERMRDEDCDGIKVDGVNYVPASTIYAQVQDRSEFVEWALTHDDQLIEHKERKALLNQLVREHLDNGEPLPPGLGHYSKDYISLRSA